MPQEVIFKALDFGLIWFLMVVALTVLLISMSKEQRIGHTYRGAFVFAIAILGMCALLALGMIPAKVQKFNSISTSLDRS
jgi:hypothetical protein